MGRSPQESLQRVFGGQVAGQALVAAGRTTDGERPVHSLHAYFLRPGRPGRAHRVPGGAGPGRALLHHPPGHRRPAGPDDLQSDRLLPPVRSPGIEHQLPMPDVPDPESLPKLADEIREHLGALPESLERMARRQPFDIRYVERLRWTARS